jgi:uncharacterized membrane protein YeaQ/YmgE (transglycosylase-associated protein family)
MSSFGVSGADQSTMQLVIDQLEELIVTIIEEVRQRPAVAVAIMAGIAGALIGGWLASRMGRKPTVGKHVARRAGTVGDMAELAGLGLRLLENPLVRAALMNQLKKRFVP